MEPKKHYSYLFLDGNNHPDRPEFELDFNDPNQNYWISRAKRKDNYLQLRETTTFNYLSADSAKAIFSENKDNLFSFINDGESACYHHSDEMIETVEWSESNPEDSISDGSYSFYMDRILSDEEQKTVLYQFGFDDKNIDYLCKIN